MAIPRGMEMMIQSLIKMLGLDPVRMQGAVEDVAKSVHSAASDLATVKRQNSIIMRHLGIDDATTENEDDRSGLEQRQIGRA